MSAALLILTTIIWYEFLTSMSAFEILMIVRIITVLVGILCMTLYFIGDSIKVLVLEHENRSSNGDLEEVKEVLAKDLGTDVPVKEETAEFADLLGTK